MNKTTEVLDELEAKMVKAIIPIAKELFIALEKDESIESMARNLLGKIGTRIVYGKELFDKVIK